MTAHPAKFTQDIIDLVATYLVACPVRVAKILDPFAGTGRIHQLGKLELETWGLEIEPEWASMHPRTLVGDALHPPFRPESFDAVFTSPTYGNRMADHHNARDDSKRMTYKHQLGRNLNPANSGQLQWGPGYKAFHVLAWTAIFEMIRPGGLLIVNVSNHIRGGEEQKVSEWHQEFFMKQLGTTELADFNVPTPRLRFGANSKARVEFEHIYVHQKAA